MSSRLSAVRDIAQRPELSAWRAVLGSRGGCLTQLRVPLPARFDSGRACAVIGFLRRIRIPLSEFG